MNKKLNFHGLEPNEAKNNDNNFDKCEKAETNWADFKSYTKKKKNKKKAKRLKKANKKLKKKCKLLQGEKNMMQNNNTYLEQRVSSIENFLKLACFHQLVESDDRSERKRLISTITQGGQWQL